MASSTSSLAKLAHRLWAVHAPMVLQWSTSLNMWRPAAAATSADAAGIPAIFFDHPYVSAPAFLDI